MNNQEEEDLQVIRMTDDSNRKDKQYVDITFRDLYYQVGERIILNKVSGICKHGELTAILGSSGAGKTSLLNLLSQRISRSLTISIKGTIQANGRDFDANTFTNFAAYVMQDDVLPETLTVKECLQFAASLRMKGSHLEKEKRVQDVIKILKLERCADTYIGGFLLKGISGGERKRTSIGFELVMDPGVLMLDEPTSGLDSFTAFILIHQLKELAEKQKKTIIFTIHQPSSDIWNMFSRILLLVEGKFIYQGPGNQSIINYFQQMNVKVKSMSNPADFFMSKMHSLDSDNVENFPRYFSNYEQVISLTIHNEIQQQLTIELPTNQVQYSFFYQMIQIAKRGMKIYKRNPMLLQFRLVVSIFMGLFAGTIYWDLPDDKDDPYDPKVLRDRNGAIFFILLCTVFESAAPVILTFPQERAIFLREENSKMYTTFSYYMGRALIEQPFCLIFPVIFILISYWMIGLNSSSSDIVFNSILIIIITSLSGNAIGIMGGASFKDIKVASGILPVILMPIMLFAGFFQNRSTYIWWAAWMEYLSPFRYAFEAIGRIQYEGTAYLPDPIVSLDFSFGMETCIGMNFVIIIGFHIVAITILYLLRSKIQ